MSEANGVNEIKYGDSPDLVLGWVEKQLKTTGDKVVVSRGWCKRCGICIAFCPKKALDKDHEGYPVVDNEKCITCGTCEIMCPDFAIIVTGLKEKKSKEKAE
jgi:2-oxoglutarate ferredoxin oxidoreductase subunit delta